MYNSTDIADIILNLNVFDTILRFDVKTLLFGILPQKNVNIKLKSCDFEEKKTLFQNRTGILFLMS